MGYEGDYWVDESGVLQIRVAEYPNDIQEIGTIIHELLEVWKLYKRGITIEEVEAFDVAHEYHEDPGCLPDAPYFVEHMESMDVEKLLCRQMLFNWNEYYNTPPIGAEGNI